MSRRLPYSKDALDRFHPNRASPVQAKTRTRETPRRRLADWDLFVLRHRAACLTRIATASSTWPGRTCRRPRHTCRGARPMPKKQNCQFETGFGFAQWNWSCQKCQGLKSEIEPSWANLYYSLGCSWSPHQAPSRTDGTFAIWAFSTDQ